MFESEQPKHAVSVQASQVKLPVRKYPSLQSIQSIDEVTESYLQSWQLGLIDEQRKHLFIGS